MLNRARTTITGITAAAMLAATSVVAVPAASAASAGLYNGNDAPLVLVLDRRTQDSQRERDRRKHDRYHYHDYDDFPAAIFGFAAGAVFGSMLSRPHYYGNVDDYCAAKFKTYKPWTGTYRGYDGYEHPCP